MHIKKIYRNEASTAKSITNATHDIDAINADAEEMVHEKFKTVSAIYSVADKYFGGNYGRVRVDMTYNLGDVYIETPVLRLVEPYHKRAINRDRGIAAEIEADLMDIPGVENAVAEVTGFGEGDFKAIIGKLDINHYSRGSITIPDGISLAEFSRKYVGADATNKRVGTPCHIAGCGTLDDGTEFVAYKSEGTGWGKKYRVTSLTTFVKIFGAIPVAKHSRNSVIGPDISEYIGKEYYDKRDVRNPRVYVVGSFISDEGRNCVVVEYVSGSDKYGWMGEGSFELNYKEMPA